MTTTSINFHLRPSVREGRHKGKLFIRVIRARQCRNISTDYALYTDEWDPQARKIIFPPDTSDDPDRHYRLSLIRDCMNRDLERLHGIVTQLSERGDYTVGDVARQFMASPNRCTVSGYAGIAAGRLLDSGRERTAKAYLSAARSLCCFNGGKDVPLSEINAALIQAYERHLIGKELKLNTVSFYLRNLRALYFRAVSEKLISRQPDNPFAGAHTGVYETRRRALSSDQLRALAALDETLSGELEGRKSPPPEGSGSGAKSGSGYSAGQGSGTGAGAGSGQNSGARGSGVPSAQSTGSGSSASSAAASRRPDTGLGRRMTPELHDALLYFLFCYHARGMSFVDMAYLQKQDIGKDTLTYRRRKTGRPLEVKVTKPMRRILAHFRSRTAGSQYAFPVICGGRGNHRRQYEAGLKKQNRLLKSLAAMAGIADGLSTHAARHTWATTAKRLKYPVDMICEALGHRDAKTTGIYLASFERSVMDELSVKVSAAVRAA